MLEDPLQRKDALGATEFIDDKGHVHTVRKQLGQGRFKRFLAVDADHVALDPAQVESGQVTGIAKDVLDVDQPDTAVQVAVAKRKPGMAGFLGHLEIVLQRQVQIEILDLVTRQQHIGYNQILHEQRVLEDKLGHHGHLGSLLAEELDLGLKVE